MGKNHINWTEIETEYITGRMSYKDIAESKGISLSAIKAHGVQGGWNRKRSEHRQDCTARAADKIAESAADKAAALRELVDDAALELAKELNSRLHCCQDIKPSELLQFARVWQVINDSMKDEPDERDTGYGVVILPAREFEDPPPDGNRHIETRVS